MITKEDYYRRKAAKEAQRKEQIGSTWRGKLKEPITQFTALVALFTFLLFVVAALQWHTLEKTDDTLNRTLQITQRPWIDVSAEIDGPLEWNDDGFVIPFKTFAKNTGYAPASNLFVTIRPVPIKKQPFYLAEILRENCDTSSAVGKNAFGKVVFRDGMSPQRVRSSVSNSEFGGQIVPTFVVICAAYSLSFTRACLQLSRMIAQAS
jgi:hypothetical protein